MTNIFIDIPILLEHQFQVAKDVFLGYHLTIESNIPLLLCGSTDIMLNYYALTNSAKSLSW
jgi:hypothetical protein